MVGKLVKFLFLCIFSVIIFSVASIAGARNDLKKEFAGVEMETGADAEDMGENAMPSIVNSPFTPYAGGVLDLAIDYEVQSIGNSIYVSVLSNLPDGFDLSAEVSNVGTVVKELGFEGISPSALTQEQMEQINQQAYSKKERNFVSNGVCTFMFEDVPRGQLDLNVTSPIIKLQSGAIQEMLGESGVNFQGSYVVYLEEVADKSINYSTSFVLNEAAQ